MGSFKVYHEFSILVNAGLRVYVRFSSFRIFAAGRQGSGVGALEWALTC